MTKTLTQQAATGGESHNAAHATRLVGDEYLQQGDYSAALAAYAEARQGFELLNQFAEVAMTWHQAGLVYEQAEQPQEAVDAYRQALAIWRQLDEQAALANTLEQLGNLYRAYFDLPAEEVVLFGQLSELYAAINDNEKQNEARRNLADALRRQACFDEARQQIQLVIQSEAAMADAEYPWSAWAILADIETDANNSSEAVAANKQARACYLAYLRGGGRGPLSRLSFNVAQSLLADDAAQAAFALRQFAINPEFDWLHDLIPPLQAIVSGSRDPSLADTPEWDFSMGAEILWVLEMLNKGKP